ncbi:hypothetical protein [Komagataeibacter sp. FNDCF1]|uniref:hypothetical protein n=1 Tax=Komagataeibacter sp. FNDCF1 TaxID=2878681 RepID=UPI001E3E50CC|nr:hypothetical protein [Komagataeibacter sp. FNDCF1]MCE2565436.1 hypothetical protein [Komagataeibacter sp. FNDCF1]
MNASKSNTKEVILPLLIFSFLLLARFYYALFHGGRFLAEEGNIFFEKAWTSSWSEALFYSYGGYLNIVANASTLLACRLMPLADAPYLTMAIALLFQICAPLLILTARDTWLATPRVRYIAAALLLLVPESAEVSLHSIHSQYHLALCAGLIVSLATETGWREGLRRILLFLAPLSGPGGVIFAPLFILRACVDRSRARLVECLLINVASAIQVLFFFKKFDDRVYSFNFYDFVLVFLNHYIMYPFIGLKHALVHFGMHLQDMERMGNPPYFFVGLTLVILVLLGAVLVYEAIRHSDAREAIWFALAGGMHASASLYGALGGAITAIPAGNAERYVFVGQSLFALCILCLAMTGTRVISRTCWYLVYIMLAMGAYHYIAFGKNMVHGPSWWEETARWKQDHSHVLLIWPEEPQWTMRLN